MNGLVLAGGGVTGIAWHLGVIEALRAKGVDLGSAGLIVGTSAGSVVGVQLATGQLGDAIAQQEREQTSEIAADVDLMQWFVKTTELARGAEDERELLRRFGAYALEAKTIDEAKRRAVIAARLPVATWPRKPLKITAIEARSGELIVFDRDSGVGLVDAVAASCAVPGVWPPATIGGHRYIDGGVRSFTNADLAVGCERVLVMIPVATQPQQVARLAQEQTALGGSRVHVIQVDAAAIAAIGLNALDPSRRRPALEAGRRQGQALAGELAAFWR